MFLSRGYEATSMDSIAEAVGVTKPAVYYHFDSKEALFCELFTRLWESMSAEYFGLIGAAPDLKTAIRGTIEMLGAISDAYLGPQTGNAGSDLGYLPAVLDGARMFPERIGKMLEGFYADFAEMMVSRIEEARAAGEVRPDVDADALAMMLIGLVEGLLLVGSIAPSVTYRGREQALFETIWNGIGNETDSG
jgi:TetR/AcrR family acrAB operon transcriptional repressor